MLRTGAITPLLLCIVGAHPMLGQVCPDGSPPPCRAAPVRVSAPPPLPGSPQRPFTIVAEFGGTALADVRAAAKNLVVSALEESYVVAALPDEQVKLGLTLAGRDTTSAVDVGLARELAMRGSVRTVTTGTIDRVGRTFHVAVRVVDTDSDRAVATGRAIARGEDDLIPTLDRVVRSVRTTLGERRAAIAANRPLDLVVTPSFAAYQQYRRGRELVARLDNFGARDAYKSALALDPDFALAWRGLAAVYFNLGFNDSSTAATREARAHPDRLTEQWRFRLIEVPRICSTEGAAACLAAQEQAFRRFGGSPVAGIALTMHRTGRDSEAVAFTEEWARVAPFGLAPLERLNFAQYLLPVGRYDEARRLAATLPGEFSTHSRMLIAEWTADWSAADSLAASYLQQSRNLRFRAQAVAVRAAVAVARGRVQEAFGLLSACARCWPAELELHVVVGPAVSRARGAGPPPDSSPAGQLNAAVWAAAASDTAATRDLLVRFRALPPERQRGLVLALDFLEGLVAATAGQSADAVRLLLPLSDARATGDPWYAQPAQWLLGGAYERAGRLDSAVAQLEQLAGWRGGRGDVQSLRGLTHSFAHQRLVVLYARMGRVADARRHWQVFSTTFTQPDPEMQHFVDEARAALASAEGRN